MNSSKSLPWLDSFIEERTLLTGLVAVTKGPPHDLRLPCTLRFSFCIIDAVTLPFLSNLLGRFGCFISTSLCRALVGRVTRSSDFTLQTFALVLRPPQG